MERERQGQGQGAGPGQRPEQVLGQRPGQRPEQVLGQRSEQGPGQRQLPACPVETTLMLISDRWKVLIIRDLLDGTRRFGELKKSIGGISQKVLTANLRAMEEDGLVSRKVYAQVPPRVEYTLTDTGYSLKPILDAMVDWGSAYKKGLL